jgi:mono/diheme cytochrome c family protein
MGSHDPFRAFGQLNRSARALAIFTGVALGGVASGCGSQGDGLIGPIPTPSPPGRGVSEGPPPNATGPRPDFGKTVTLETAPPAITGGTLLVTSSGTTAVASDPDRDRIYVVDLASQTLTASLALHPGDEPGRLTEDGQGNAVVALRRGGALVTVDVAKAQIVARRPVCAAPRGVTYDPDTDNLYVACNGGELVTLPARGGNATRILELGPDLRDVVVQNGSLFVSRLRRAEVIDLDANGNVANIGTPPTSSSNMEPAIAWRLIAVPPASNAAPPAMAMIHQRAQPSPVSVGQGGYGQSSGPSCMSSIVESTITVFNGATADAHAAPVIPAAVLPVDLAISSDGRTFGLVAAGNGHTASMPGVYFLARSRQGGIQTGDSGCAGDMASTAVPGQATAIALISHDVAWVQSREPARLFQVKANDDGTAKITATVVLSTTSEEDTGHSIVHSNSGAFVACASCHAEGGDDARVWRFQEGGGVTPARRTQSMRGTLAGTAPYHWEGDMTDISMLAHEVFVKRMDGQSLTDDQSSALQAWLFAVPAPAASPTADSTAVARGKALFQSPDVGCFTCHAGAKYTNNATIDVGTGGMFQVPSLIGVGWRAPYLHDGRAPQLVDRFNPALAGAMHGHTSQLSSAQIDDLVQFLETL